MTSGVPVLAFVESHRRRARAVGGRPGGGERLLDLGDVAAGRSRRDERGPHAPAEAPQPLSLAPALAEGLSRHPGGAHQYDDARGEQPEREERNREVLVHDPVGAQTGRGRDAGHRYRTRGDEHADRATRAKLTGPRRRRSGGAIRKGRSPAA